LVCFGFGKRGSCKTDVVDERLFQLSSRSSLYSFKPCQVLFALEGKEERERGSEVEAQGSTRRLPFGQKEMKRATGSLPSLSLFEGDK